MTTCNRCGGVLSANSRICQHCGALVSDAAGSKFGGTLGARQRAQEKERLMQQPASGPFAAFQAPPLPGSSSYPPSLTSNPAGGAAGQGQWQAPSLIDAEQLPEWLRPPSAPPGRPGMMDRRPLFPAGNFEPPPFQHPAPVPFYPPSAGPTDPGQPPARPRTGGTPFLAGGRRSTDDLFASSSLLDQSRLPDWLQRGPVSGPLNQPSAGMPPPAGNVNTFVPPGVQPFGQPGNNPSAAGPAGEALPEWLRAMDPGAPPPSVVTGRFPPGGPRPQPNTPAFPGGNRPAGPERRDPFGSQLPGADPFGASRGRANSLPPLDLFGSGRPAESSLHSPAGGADLFGGRAPLGQPPEQRARPLNFSGNPGANPFGASSPPGASPFGAPTGPGASSFGRPGASGPLPFGAPNAGPPAFGPFGETALSPQGTFPPNSSPRPPVQPGSSFVPPRERMPAGSATPGDNLPEWLRILPANEGQPERPFIPPDRAPRSRSAGFAFSGDAPGNPVAPGNNAGFPPFPPLPPLANKSGLSGPSPFEAASLIDERELPGWLSGTSQTEPLPLPFAVSDSLTGGKAPREAGNPLPARPATPPLGNSEEEALPEWLRQVYTDARIPALPPQPPARPVAETPAPRFNASDLLDDRSMPSWIREANETSPLPGKERPGMPDAGAGLVGLGLPGDRPGAGPALPPFSRSPETPFLSANSLLEETSLPAWLRNIEADGPPTPFKSQLPPTASAKPPTGSLPSGTVSGIFSAAELIDTQALPAWLKPDGEPGALPTGKAAPPAQRPEGGSPNFSAAELVDTQTLPTWLKAEGEKPAPARSLPPLGSASGLFSPAELIDTQALPAWLKAEGEKAGAGSPGDPTGPGKAVESKGEGVSKLSPMPTGFAKQQTGSFSAAELVDTQALPAWLKGATGDSSAAPAPAAQPPARGGRPPSEAERFSAAELIDTQDLPAWLKEAEQTQQSGRQAAPERSGGLGDAAVRESGALSPVSSQSGSFSAQDLLDPTSLPAWLQPAQAGGESVAPPSADDWQAAAAQPDAAQERAGTLPGASLIDANELPGWLRGQSGLQRPGARQGEGEPEEGLQARVPHRPRLPTEANRAPSQAAASVFSSVLGPNAGEEPPGAPPAAGGASQRDNSPSASKGGASGARNAPRQPETRESGQMSGRVSPAGPPPQPRPPERSANAGAEGEPGRGMWPQPPANPSEWEDMSAGSGTASGFRRDEKPGQGWSGAGEMDQGRQRGFGAAEAAQPMQAWPESAEGRRRASGRMGADGVSGSPVEAPEDPYTYDPSQWPGQQGPAYPSQEAGYSFEEGWEGGPDYEQDFRGDDEVGPPSGIFAKIKRVLGFKRS